MASRGILDSHPIVDPARVLLARDLEVDTIADAPTDVARGSTATTADGRIYDWRDGAWIPRPYVLSILTPTPGLVIDEGE